MNEKDKSFHSFKEFSKAFKEENKEKLEMQEIFNSYGLDVPIDSLDDLHIIKRSKDFITYLDKKTNMIITSNLVGKIYKKWDSLYSVGLTTFDPEKNFFVEQYNSIDAAKTYDEAGENAMKARNNPETKLVSRAYTDVSTKYGDFCLHLEESYTDYRFGPYRSVSLYHGNHEQVIENWNNEFDFARYCLFRWKCIKRNNFDQWMMGYASEGPKINSWSYGDIPLYSKDDGGVATVISMDGSLKLMDNLEYISFLYGSELKEDYLKQYEDMDCTSKAYFSSYGILVAVIKQGNTINIDYRNQREYWNLCYSDKVISATNQRFTKEDFENIIERLEQFPLIAREKKSIISVLSAYINTHDEKDFATLNTFTLKPYTFEDMLQYVKQQDLGELVERGIETVSDTFNVDVEEILGKNPPKHYVKK